MNINYEHYKTFYYVAMYKNLTYVAEILNNSQPNISRTIKLLEQELNCKLIIRKSRGIELTEEGVKLFNHVQIAVSQFQAAESELSSILSPKAGTVTIGASETAAYMVLFPALNKFKSDYPNIKIKLLSHDSTTAIDYVRQGLVDFSISSVFDKIEDPLVSTTLLEYRDSLVGGKDFSNKKESLTLEELSRLPIVSLAPNSATYKLYKKFFYEHNLDFNPQYEVETTGQILPMLLYNLGIAFIPSIYIQNSLKLQNVYELSLKEVLPTRKICIIKNKNYNINAGAKKLIEYCQQQLDYISF